MKQRKIRVLVVDDSSVVRSLLSRILNEDPEIEVVGVAPDAFVAREKLVALNPDVMTLDIEMPKLDGITFLEKVMKYRPTPTVIVSGLSIKGSQMALRAYEIGAVEVVAKPVMDVSKGLNEIGVDIIHAVKSASQANLKKVIPLITNRVLPISKIKSNSLITTASATKLLAIGSSTGGTTALKTILPSLPPEIPATVIVQHMPPVFTKVFAQHLQELCPFEVKEAEDGDRVFPGRCLIAPGDYHMEIVKSGAGFYVKLHQQPPIHGVRPAVDYLMKSVAKVAGANSIGVILTGMGADGAEGLLQMKKAGAFTIAQNEETCVVYGMPKQAIDLGAVSKVLGLEDIASGLVKAIA